MPPEFVQNKNERWSWDDGKETILQHTVRILERETLLEHQVYALQRAISDLANVVDQLERRLWIVEHGKPEGGGG